MAPQYLKGQKMSLQGREVSDELSLVLIGGTFCIAVGLWIWLTLLPRFTKHGRVTGKVGEPSVPMRKKKRRKR